MKKTITTLATIIAMATPFAANAQSHQTAKTATTTEAMKLLNITNRAMLDLNLPNGYITSKPIRSYLNVLAGIYSGTVQVTRTENGYSANGQYCEMQNPDALSRVLNEADTNHDKIITVQEITNLKNKIFEENAEYLTSSTER
jgi:hypothetical protein